MTDELLRKVRTWLDSEQDTPLSCGLEELSAMHTGTSFMAVTFAIRKRGSSARSMSTRPSVRIWAIPTVAEW